MIKNLDNDLFCSADNKTYKELIETIEQIKKDNDYCLAVASADDLSEETQAFIKISSDNIVAFVKSISDILHQKFDISEAYFCCEILETSIIEYQKLTKLKFDYEIHIITSKGTLRFKGGEQDAK